MPVGETFHLLIDSNRRHPEFVQPEDMLPALSSFVMMSTVQETAHTGQNLKHVEAHESHVYTFARIQEEETGGAALQFARAAAALKAGESVGVTVYVYDHPTDIPVTAIRMSDDQKGVDVLFRWPENIALDAVGSETQ